VFSAFQKLKSMIGNPEIELYFGDLNAVEAKDFKVVYAGASATNRPVNVNGYCVTMAYNPNRSNKKQIYYVQSNSNLVFERTCNSGVWTEWISKQQTITTGTEYETGRIIDGKKEYGKRINCGNLPNAEVKYVQTGLQNITLTKSIDGVMLNVNSQRGLPAPSITSTNTIMIYLNGTGTALTINTQFNWSSYTAYVELFYTKN